MTNSIVYLVFLNFLLSQMAFSKESVVKVRIKDAELKDLSQNTYPVRFSRHRGTTFSLLKKGQWLYGILTQKSVNRNKIYKIELPELGRLIYSNPDTGNPVILDQVEHHHPSFEWTVKSLFDLDSRDGKTLVDNLAQERFMYQTLIGDVFVKFDVREVQSGRNTDYVRALRFNAPRKKVVREILRYKNIL